MKRVDHLLPAIANPENLRLAFWKASKGKRYSTGVLDYQKHLEGNLLVLRREILSGYVKVGNYRFFKVFDPKERQICASAFGEQVLHHAVMNICHAYFEQAQIFDSYASRKGKGTYAAIQRARSFTRRHAWYLKLDVRKFFESAHHQALKDQLARMFKDGYLLRIFEQIIDSYEAHPERGLPIGNLCSQYFANHYLTGLDHFIKEQLRIKAYVRYMDDMVLWHDEKAVLRDAFLRIREYVETRLRCELKPETLNKTRQGLSFLGYRIFPHKTVLTQRSKNRFIRKYRELEEKYHSGEWSEAICQRRALPLLAFLGHADAKKFRKRVIFPCGGQSS